ncbi:MAG: TonB-dependent receptor [Bacteroidales bacterium]
MRYTILFLLLMMGLFFYGQEPEIERFALGHNDLVTPSDSNQTKVSAASRSAKFIEDLPVTVYVIPRKEILENGYTSLVDVLKDVPGIKVSQPGSGIEGETFLMNGLFGNYYCKVLVDGMPITPSVASGIAISGNLPVRQAERIEIISGPAAALYGSDALAGVINIITMESERPVWSQADLSLGSQESYNMNVMIGGKFGKNKNVAEYRMYGNYNQKGDMNVKYDIAGNYNPLIYDTNAVNQPYYRGTKTEPAFNNLPLFSSLLGFGLKYRNFKVNYDHMSRRSHSSIGQNTGQYGYYDPSSYWGENIDRLSLAYFNSWGKIASSSYISYLRYKMDNNSSFRSISDKGDDGKVYQYAASDDIFFDEILTWTINTKLEINGGFSFQYSGNLPKTNGLSQPFEEDQYQPFSDTVTNSDPITGYFGYNPTNFYNVAGYFQLYYKFWKMTLLAGLRWDEHAIFGHNLSPKLGLQYVLNKNISFRVNYGQGYRTPSLVYVYASEAFEVESNGMQKIYYQNIPNPEVKPELFRAFEFGVRHNTFKNVQLAFIFQYHKLNENISLSGIKVDPGLYPNNANDTALAAINDKNSKAELYIGQIIIRATDIIPRIHLNSGLFITLSTGREVLPNNLGHLDSYRNMPGTMVQWNIDIQLLNKWIILFHNNFSDKWNKRFFHSPPMK